MKPSSDELVRTAWKRNYSVDTTMELLQFHGYMANKESILLTWVALDETKES